jgi:hypothetical protein
MKSSKALDNGTELGAFEARPKSMTVPLEKKMTAAKQKSCVRRACKLTEGDPMNTRLQEIHDQIGTELAYIPKGSDHKQGMLRALYQMGRMKSLGKNAAGRQSAYDVLQSSLAAAKQALPEYEFRYDQEFFRPLVG